MIDYGLRPYAPVLEAMQRLTRARCDETLDEVWLVQHESVYTQGQAGRDEHLLAPNDIAVIQSDRGGQVTYHGPGQLVLYTLCVLGRYGMNVRDWVSLLEASAIAVAAHFGIAGATSAPSAPGVYVGGEKLAALGLRVRRGAIYHGLSLNVDMDLEPYTRINPCGVAHLKVTSLSRCLGRAVPVDEAAAVLIDAFCSRLGASPTRIQAHPPLPLEVGGHPKK